MNVFRERIDTGEISSEADLKRVFRALALRLHPDTCLDGASADRFRKLRRDFDEALRERGWDRPPPAPGEPFSFTACVELFGELVGSNFPADPRVSRTNKAYRRRAERLDALLGTLGGGYAGLFRKAEAELETLRGDDIVDNPDFNLVKIFLCNLYDWLSSRHGFSGNYVRAAHPGIREILSRRGCPAAARFVDFMVTGGARRTGEAPGTWRAADEAPPPDSTPRQGRCT